MASFSFGSHYFSYSLDTVLVSEVFPSCTDAWVTFQVNDFTESLKNSRFVGN